MVEKLNLYINTDALAHELNVYCTFYVGYISVSAWYYQLVFTAVYHVYVKMCCIVDKYEIVTSASKIS